MVPPPNWGVLNPFFTLVCTGVNLEPGFWDLCVPCRGVSDTKTYAPPNP